MGVWFVVFAGLADLFPRSGDDWNWGSRLGAERFHVFFAGVNGRYAGSLLVLILTRTGPLAGIVLAAVVCVSLVLVLQLSGNRTPFGYGLVGALFLAMPLGVWRQGISWLSGFVNYGVGALFLLGFLTLAQSEWFRPAGQAATKTPAWWKFAATAVAGFIGQLFIEHVTICICVLGVVLSLAGRRVHKAWPRLTTTWTIAALLGAVAMFSNSAYRHVVAGTSKYQGVQPLRGKKGNHQLAIRLLDYLPTQAVEQNLALNAVLLVLLVLLVARSRRLAGRWTGWTIAALATSLVWAGLTYGLWLVERHGVTRERERALAFVGVVLLACALILAGAKLLSDRRQRWTLWLLIAATVVLIGPLLVVSPLGPRNFYPSYLLLLTVAALLAKPATASLPVLRPKVLALASHAVALTLMVILFVIYVDIHTAADDRLAEIRAAVRAGQSTVVITPLPHSYYVHDGDPYSPRLTVPYKRFNHLPRTLKIRLVPNPWIHHQSTRP